MAATVYEATAGDCLANVQALCRHLCGSGGFSTTTTPTLVEVNFFADMAYYKVAAHLEMSGYSKTQTDADVLHFLMNLQVLEWVILIELTYPIAGSGEVNERFLEFARQRDVYYDLIMTDALDNLGATRTARPSLNIKATGVSVDDKQAVNDVADNVPPRFYRGIGQNASTASDYRGRLGADTL